MEETIRALQANEARPEAGYGDCSLFPGMRLPSKFKIPEFKTYEGRGHSDVGGPFPEIHRLVSVLHGNASDPLGIEHEGDGARAKIRRIRYQMACPRGKAHPSNQRSTTDPVIPFHPEVSQPTQRVPPPQGQQGGAAQPRPRRQYPSQPVPLSHIYRQLRDKIGTIAPALNFDPTIQDRSKQAEYHRGAPGHTLDTCWRLRERIQEMIHAKELVFNAVRSPNVQANPLPDHGSARGPSINMISICALGEGESEQGCPSPFGIEYVPAETVVGFTGIDASPTPFVIDVPAREPYSDDKVPWTYEGGVGSLEQQFGFMGIIRSGRVYENPVATNKGKAPTAETEAILGVPPTPPKEVTEEEAEAFMKIIKASEYKVRALLHILPKYPTRRGELLQGVTTRRSPGPKRDASHDLWLPPLIEHATKEGQAVNTLFWSTGSDRGLPIKARDTIHNRKNGGECAGTES
ncbi:hypothetical protein CRG98_038296 [Punica granatum]|uniref:Uncharacterized protein n=1 Tax=Punica granatum TaxID=22663 RepID=A0A2I0ICA0_PUNGR|nr:hypothetical protein CRG98_038296 [Punica granatum]